MSLAKLSSSLFILRPRQLRFFFQKEFAKTSFNSGHFQTGVGKQKEENISSATKIIYENNLKKSMNVKLLILKCMFLINILLPQILQMTRDSFTFTA